MADKFKFTKVEKKPFGKVSVPYARVSPTGVFFSAVVCRKLGNSIDILVDSDHQALKVMPGNTFKLSKGGVCGARLQLQEGKYLPVEDGVFVHE